MYRDELAAATARADALEREVELLRKRTEELESGEALENARRLEDALLRERDELRRHSEQELERERVRVHRAGVRNVMCTSTDTGSRAAATVAAGIGLATLGAMCEDGAKLVIAFVLLVTGGVLLGMRPDPGT